VLANSTIINANAETNSDLFVALKGGGPNYGGFFCHFKDVLIANLMAFTVGIVTRFDLYTVPLHQVWYKFNMYNISQYEQILAATVEVQDAMEDDDKAGFIFNADQGVVLVGFIYAQWTQRPAVFKAFDDLTPISVFAAEANGTVLSLSSHLNIGNDVKAK
jgi:hypothetical protein